MEPLTWGFSKRNGFYGRSIKSSATLASTSSNTQWLSCLRSRCLRCETAIPIVLSYRTTPSEPCFVAILFSISVGRLLARILPENWLEPGSFSIGEHVLCKVMIESTFLRLGLPNRRATIHFEKAGYGDRGRCGVRSWLADGGKLSTAAVPHSKKAPTTA
ncbi:uncharacterized protein EV422DRAFT_86102 [Fimicolochytrium jonesii]|uniref:uncharacterized protein n=1 Tax=Fimicolochytrium jonesii TaxID=1396493 RepID=UPI0022FF4499|nr:uncharacterized protein EV422DRAFT_86102 [Fimicolochytrium jonesii]KAI8820283.1 hypothetical protein EV422DRAFT_86102 [Fimicolochytrium jonesii]